MSQDPRVALTTSLNDQLVGPLRRALDEVEKNFRQLQLQLQGVTAGSQQAGQAMTAIQGPARAAQEVARLAQNTQGAINWAEKLKAAWSVAGNTIRGVTATVAGVQAARMVVAEPLKQARAYELQLANAANIAYDPGERRKGMGEMDAAVVSAVRAGGGDREGALKGLNDLFAANIDKKDVLQLLPTMQKYATAGNADMANIAQLVIFGLKSMKLPASEIPKMLDKTLASTKQGSMEFDTLAKWMPQVGAAGGAAGLGGMKGYEQMLAGLQVARLTAGTKDEAGTNFRDLLSLINGHALSTAAKRIGIDATGTLAKHIEGGGNALSGIIGLADYVAEKDPRFAAIQKKLDASKIARDRSGRPLYTPEQEDLMKQQAMLFQGSALGQLFHNQQSMQALVALRTNRDYFKDLLGGTGKAQGQVGEQDFSTIASTNYFKNQQAENEKLFAQTRGLEGVNNALGKLAEGTTELYRKYPELGSAMETTKVALNALAAAAVGAGAANLVTGGGGGLIGRVAGWFGIGAAGAGAAGAAGAGALALGAAGVGAAGLVGYGAGYLINKGIEGTSVQDEIGKLVASVMAGFGSKDAQEALDKMAEFDGKRAAEHTAALQRMEAVAQRPIKLVIDGREIAAAVNQYNDFVTRRN